MDDQSQVKSEGLRVAKEVMKGGHRVELRIRHGLDPAPRAGLTNRNWAGRLLEYRQIAAVTHSAQKRLCAGAKQQVHVHKTGSTSKCSQTISCSLCFPRRKVLLHQRAAYTKELWRHLLDLLPIRTTLAIHKGSSKVGLSCAHVPACTDYTPGLIA